MIIFSNRAIYIIAITLIHLGKAPASGQQPQAPYVLDPPKNGSYKLSYQSSLKNGQNTERSSVPTKPDEPQDIPTLIRVEYRASGKLQELTEVISEERKRRVYLWEDIHVGQNSYKSPYSVFRIIRSATDNLLLMEGFYGLKGLDGKDFKKKDEKYGIPCYRYELEKLYSQGEDSSLLLGERTVWINMQTRFPVALLIGNHEYKFTISKNDPGRISVDPQAKAVWKKHRAALNIAFGKNTLPVTPLD